MGWRRPLTRAVLAAESVVDVTLGAARRRLGLPQPLMIVAYRGYGTRRRLHFKARVLEERGVEPSRETDGAWTNAVNMYRRLASHEVPRAQVRIRFGDLERVVEADGEGFLDVWLELDGDLPSDRMWFTVHLELLRPRPRFGPVRSLARVLVPPPSARRVVVSDIDDTVVHTGVTRTAQMVWTMFTGSARSRLAFPGVPAFYRALHRGAGAEYNPLLYVSRGPWNLYDVLSQFFQLQEIPVGPVLYLRDWGLSGRALRVRRAPGHKLELIRRMLEVYTDLPFILIGDSGQHDPEIYADLAAGYPNRIEAVYIRNVSRRPERPVAVRALADRLAAAGSSLVLSADTEAMAEHAAEHGFIAPDEVAGIHREAEADREAAAGFWERFWSELAVEEPRAAARRVEGPGVSGEAAEAAVRERAAGGEPVPVVSEGAAGAARGGA